jgi:hypothetical protein
MERTLGDTLADAQALTPEDELLARKAVQERRKALGRALAALALRFSLEGEARSEREVARGTVPQVQWVEAGAPLRGCSASICSITTRPRCSLFSRSGRPSPVCSMP